MQNIINTNNLCLFFFQDFAGAGKAGLSVTVDIYGPNPGAGAAPIVADGICYEIAGGLYAYARDFTGAGLFPFVAKTASSEVQAKHLAGVWQIGGWPDDLLTNIYNLTHTTEGEPVSIVIPPPSGAYQCRVFAPCYDQASLTPLDAVTATCRITAPYYYEGKYHDIRTEQGTLSALDGNGNRFVYWDLVWGSRVLISIEEMGISKRGTVPALASVHVADL